MSKIFLDKKHQLKHLKSLNINIGSESKAKRILFNVNYQRLLAYRVQFYIPTTKIIKSGTKLKHIYKLHEFDKELRNLTNSMINIIELNLRRHIAYYCSNENIHYYLDYKNFRKYEYYISFISNINKTFSKTKPHNIISYHSMNYTDPLPIYKLVELLTFGQLSKFFSNMNSSSKGINKYPKDKILLLYKNNKLNSNGKNLNLKSSTLESWFRELVEIRNKCAHFDMLWNYENNISPIKGNIAWKNGTIKQNQNLYKFYGICLIFRFLLCNNNEFKKFMKNIEILINKNINIITFKDLGFPNNWKNDLNI